MTASRAARAGGAETSSGRSGRLGAVLLRLIVTAGLGVDAAVHWHVAGSMGLAAPGGIGGDTLFRVQAGLAAVTAMLVLITGRRVAYVLAVLVASNALAAVLAYTYIPIPTIGPIPSMYDPAWYPEKILTAVAEAVALIAAVLGLRGRPGGSERPPR